MAKAAALIVTATAACLMLVVPADARRVHHHLRHAHVHYTHLRYMPTVPHYSHPGIMRDVLVANPYGDVIIDGTTGFHRSDLGVMVPDSEPPSFVAVGRESGSGLGANGLPGYNR